jgi:Ni,Fe-hydrogenase I large subunit
MGIEGSLIIRLQTRLAAANAVSIESSRPLYACRVFIGKDVAESLQLIPLLFNICATAQSCAAVRACEQALGLRAVAEIEQKRDQLVNMETLREHLWRILLDWPAFIDRNADSSTLAEVVALQRAYQQALSPQSKLFQPDTSESKSNLIELNAVADSVANLLQQSLFSMPVAQWLTISTHKELAQWVKSSQTIPARLIDHIMLAGWSGAGRCDSVALPVMDEAQLHESMQQKQYLEQPQWQGECCETSSLTRIDSPLLESLKQVYGNGLLVRLVARLTEIAQLSEKLLPHEADSRGEIEACEPGVCNPGIGQARAARGQLVHRIALDGKVIQNYQILAPTEWNFHPQGVVAHALASLQGEQGDVEKQAHLLINAIDPCVAYQLHIE